MYRSPGAALCLLMATHVLAAPPRGCVWTEIATWTTSTRRRFSNARLGSPFDAGGKRLCWGIFLKARTIFPCPSFADRQRPAFKRLIVQEAYALLSVSLVVKFDKGKPLQPTAFPIRWEIDVRKGTDCREVLSQLGFSRIIREISHKQSNRHRSSPVIHWSAFTTSMRVTLNRDWYSVRSSFLHAQPA